MGHYPLLADLVVILAAAIAVILISHRARIPSLIGLLLTGILIGPSGFALVASSDEVELIAEIGVVALLFSIGLEFSLDRLREIRRAFFVGGTLQAVLTFWLAAAAAYSFLIPAPTAVFVGFAVVLSSTAIVLRLFSDRREAETPHGKLVVGILLFQDFLVVPMIVVTPVLGGRNAASAPALIGRFGLGILTIALVFVVARWLMPWLLRAMVRTRIRELFVLGSVTCCLALALVTEYFQFSLALGAFIAGIVISESEYSHQVVADVIPFKDVFNSVFFISIGMLLRLDFVANNLGLVLAVTVGVVVVKATVVFAIVLAMKYPPRTATLVGISLAQMGEFSFVLVNIGHASGVIGERGYQLVIASAILTMMATPLLVGLSPRLAEATRRLLPDRGAGSDEAGLPTPLGHHVIVVGFGVNGTNVARVLRETSIPYVVVELDGDRVRRARERGEPSVYGDVSRASILEHAGIETARAIVFAISDPTAIRAAVRLARRLNPRVHIIVRTRSVTEIDAIYAAGADTVLAEELETSIEIFTRVLEQYHVPGNIIRAQRQILRDEKYDILRSTTPRVDVSESIVRILAEGVTEVFRVEDGTFAVGRRVAEIDLGGAAIAAVVRGREATVASTADLRVRSGDFLVIAGDHAEIERAITILSA